MSEHRIVFTPSGLNGAIADGTTVLDAARMLGVDLDSVCGGRGVCGRCQVTPAVGSFAKWDLRVDAGALGPPDETERSYRGHRPLVTGQRLGCAARVCGDVVVDVPATSQVHRQVVRKELDLAPTAIDPSFALCYLEIGKAVPAGASTAADLIGSAVVEQHGRARPHVPFRTLAHLHHALEHGTDDVSTTVTVAIDDRDDIVAIWPGFVGDILGLAFDIGSTTVAGHLCSLLTGELLASAGRMNPQIRFGEDLMSRVSYVMMNPGGARELTAAIRNALDGLVTDLLERAGMTTDRVLEVVLVGNPIMHHILLGIDPTPLGQAPFTLATNEPVVLPAADLGLGLGNARAYVGPCIAGHVGADTAAAVLAEEPYATERVQLLVDVGTNAEIVLGNADRLYAASSPTGPAFEGAQISAGQRATAGAIEGVRIDPATLEPRLKVIGVRPWSDEPGFIESLPDVGVTGLCGSGIIDVVAEMYLTGIIDRNGVIRSELAATSSRVVPDGRTHSYLLWGHFPGGIVVTQNDVRAIQLAKAALRAGIDLLLERAGQPEIDEIRLAGAFGAHVDPLHAMVLGLVPDCALDRVGAAGNAAGTGAVRALLSHTLRTDMERAARGIEKVETATEPRFQHLFVEAMAFPHATAPTAHLAEHVALPATSSVRKPQRPRRRRPVTS